ncbi:MAG TPA: hypothetical protein VL978_01890 [Puia sp.]|nr:hypothetical protein [Puia sp.]
MFQNYLKSAYRNLLRHRGASLIKLSGLSIGMCCCLLTLVVQSVCGPGQP